MIGKIILAILGSGVISTFISCLFAAHSEKKKAEAEREKEDDTITIAMRQLFYGRIKRYAREYIAAGHLTAEDLEDLIEDHHIYHDVLGGNGYLDSIMDKVKNLEIRD